MVRRLVWDQDFGGSIPFTPTNGGFLTAKTKPQGSLCGFVLIWRTLIYLVVTFFVAVLVVLKLPYVKGAIGETIVRIAVGKNSTNPNKRQYIINDLILENSPGKTSQIDHVVINQNGVFVIETKNYSGRIYGNESQTQWTQVLNYGKVKERFYSPIKQNEAHIQAIRKLLGNDIAICSIVVFVKGNIRYIQSPDVYTVFGMIKKLKSPSEMTISSEKMAEAYSAIVENNRKNAISNEEHIKNIETKKRSIANNVCPYCGRILVLRKGKYGSFMGCSGYPNCHFTKKID